MVQKKKVRVGCCLLDLHAYLWEASIPQELFIRINQTRHNQLIHGTEKIQVSKLTGGNINLPVASEAITRTFRKYSQQIMWAVALLMLFFMNTDPEATSLCMFKFLGFNSCPGCGIGHAIHDALHLNLKQSFDSHILGIPATVGILYIILKPFLTFKKTM